MRILLALAMALAALNVPAANADDLGSYRVHLEDESPANFEMPPFAGVLVVVEPTQDVRVTLTGRVFREPEPGVHDTMFMTLYGTDIDALKAYPVVMTSQGAAVAARVLTPDGQTEVAPFGIFGGSTGAWSETWDDVPAGERRVIGMLLGGVDGDTSHWTVDSSGPVDALVIPFHWWGDVGAMGPAGHAAGVGTGLLFAHAGAGHSLDLDVRHRLYGWFHVGHAGAATIQGPDYLSPVLPSVVIEGGAPGSWRFDGHAGAGAGGGAVAIFADVPSA